MPDSFIGLFPGGLTPTGWPLGINTVYGKCDQTCCGWDRDFGKSHKQNVKVQSSETQGQKVGRGGSYMSRKCAW